ncbi:MAG: hypothetical protein LBD37_06880 [Treponema sp.]|jgi:hypothetical protein|nr:hypothetical protein [Treponema sp.]
MDINANTRKAVKKAANLVMLLSAVLAALCSWAVMGCVSSGAPPQPQPVVIPWEAADAGESAPLPRIRNETIHLDLALRKQVDAIMQNYMDSQGEEYGYYTLHFGRWEYWKESGDWAASGGLPGTRVRSFFRWYGWLVIYDSQGNSIKAFNKRGGFKPMLINYSTVSPRDITDKETGKIYSALLDHIIKEALSRSAEINEQLRAAGPRSAANTPAALAKIHAQEEKIEYVGGTKNYGREKIWIRE